MKIAVAMSGGIDSSVTAFLLQKEGHEVIGITGQFFSDPRIDQSDYTDSLNDARAVAEFLKIPHHDFTLNTDFSNIIIDPFCRDYFSGRTPNPCINCNRLVKFTELIKVKESLGCDMLATGHYAIKKKTGERVYLSMSPDRVKDQSYFLFMLSQQQLSRSLFPIGSIDKNEIRRIAAESNIPVKDKPDSQEICFIPDNDYAAFIEKWTGKIPEEGDIVDSKGNVLGRHSGIHKYTIGQRRGMGIAAPYPLYVTSIDSQSNRIIAGPSEELNVKEFYTENVYNMKHDITKEEKVFIKTRSTQKPVPGKALREGDEFHVIFEETQTGISPGQAAVFYDDENDVIGGGIIRKDSV